MLAVDPEKSSIAPFSNRCGVIFMNQWPRAGIVVEVKIYFLILDTDSRKSILGYKTQKEVRLALAVIIWNLYYVV